MRKKRGNKDLRDRGCGVSDGQRLPWSCKSEPLPPLQADLGLRLDFAQGRSGPWVIRRLNKKTMGPGPRAPRGIGGWAWDTPRTSAQEEMPGEQGPGLQVAPTPCNSNSMWKCPLVPMGLLLSGVGQSPRRRRGGCHPAGQQGSPRPCYRAPDGEARWAVGRLPRPSAQGSDL